MNTNRPPIGGAELECHFSYKELQIDEIGNILHLLLQAGLKLKNKEPVLALSNDYMEELAFIFSGNFKEFIQFAKSEKASIVIVKYDGQLFDVNTAITISVDLLNTVVTLSATEDFIWNFSNNPENGKIERLISFVDLCKTIANDYPPIFLTIGSECGPASDFAIDTLFERDGAETFNGSQLSTEYIQNLYSWYINVYAKRWDNSIKP